jgi:membrane protease YdiL (CAAX protease family)
MLDTVVGVFWNREERRLRALWRLVAFLVVALVATLLVGTALLSGFLRSALLAAGFGTGLVGLGLNSAVTAVASVLAVGVAALALDRRRVADFGLGVDRDWWIDLGFGLALGAGLMTLVFLVELAAGWIRVTGLFDGGPTGFLLGFAAILVVFLFVGFYEELVSRGYLLTNVAEGLAGYVGPTGATAVAVLLSSAVFGFLHSQNPNATSASTLFITVAGVMLALGYVLTDELAIPVGLHVTWNLFQGAVYGFPVSGLEGYARVVVIEQSGPTLLTGGSFGPEAGLLGLGAMALGCLAIGWWSRYRYGRLAVHSGLTTPDLRWRGEDGEEPDRADREAEEDGPTESADASGGPLD